MENQVEKLLRFLGFHTPKVWILSDIRGAEYFRGTSREIESFIREEIRDGRLKNIRYLFKTDGKSRCKVSVEDIRNS